MTFTISLFSYAAGKTLGIRTRATPIRLDVETALARGDDVLIDFTGVSLTQSFADELVGALVLHRGPTVLERLTLKGCSDAVRTILKFVAADRSAQFRNRSLSSKRPAELLCEDEHLSLA